jgi:hypothetical protein
MINQGALRLLATQNTDGGWDWTGTPDTRASVGVPSPANTIGVTAMGLLKAYEQVHNPAFLNACLTSYNLMLTNSTAPGYRTRGADITFLVGLSTVTGNAVYADFARTQWDAVLANPTFSPGGTATSFAVTTTVAHRGGAKWSVFDLNLSAVGLEALNGYFPGSGYDAQAVELADVTSTTVVGLTNADDYYPLAASGAINTYTITGTHASEIPGLMAIILAAQQPDGSIDGGVQYTAYCLTSLVQAGNIGQPVYAMLNYLTISMNSAGGWTDSGGEYTEADSEVVGAISTLFY